MLKSKPLWIGIIISLGLLAVVFYGTDLQTIGEVFRNANYWVLVPALVLYFVGVYMRAIRWHFLLRSIKSIRVWRLFQVTVIGYMVNDLLPFRIGELVRAYLVGELERVSKASVLVTIVLERIFDAVALLLFIGIASLFLPLNDLLRTLLLVGTVLFSAIVLVLVLFASLRERLDPAFHFALARLPDTWGRRALKLTDSFFHGLSVLRNPRDAFAALLFSMFAWLCEAGMYAMIARGFDISLPPSVYALATAVANLVTIVPSTPGYIGVFDAPVRYILTIFGVDASVAASYTLLLHAALIIPVVVLGLFFTWQLGLSLGQLRKRSQTSVSLENV